VIEQILPGLWRIEVTLPDNPLQAVNSYVLQEDGRFLVIDTGMNLPVCKNDVDLDQTDFFITHMHHDHMGLVSQFAGEKSKVYFNKPESIFIQQFLVNARWTTLLEFNVAHGFDREEFQKSMPRFSSAVFGSRPITFTLLSEGDVLKIGDYNLTCIETPGHSPGHICLYEKDKKLLFAGDHILFDVTPNIMSYPEMTNTLDLYLKSLEKVYPLDVQLVLPAHRSRMQNHRARILEIRQHHEDRLNEAREALEKGARTAYQVAAVISWDIECDGWENFPDAQKYFAVGETIAHLEHLALLNRAKKTVVDGKIWYLPA